MSSFHVAFFVCFIDAATRKVKITYVPHICDLHYISTGQKCFRETSQVLWQDRCTTDVHQFLHQLRSKEKEQIITEQIETVHLLD